MRSAGCNSIARPVFGMPEIIPSAESLSSYLWDTTLVYPVIGAARRWFVAVLPHVDFEAFAVLLVLPVGHFIADTKEERTATEVDPANEHSTQVAKMANAVARGANGTEEFDGAHDGDEGAHGNHNRKRKKPDLTIGEENGVGDQDAKDCPACANSRNVGGAVPPKHRKNFD